MSPQQEHPDVRHIALFLVGLAAFLALALVNEIRGFDLWRNYALSGFFLGAPIIYALWRLDMRLPQYIQGIIVVAMLAHYIGGSLGSVPGPPYRMGLFGMHGINGTYHVIEWWDHLTHGLGIGATAMGFAYLFDVYQLRRGLGWNPHELWIVSVLAALTAGVGVELYEYLGKTAFQTIDQGGYENTMMDLWYNILGATVGAGLAVTINRTAFERSISEHWSIPDEQRPDGTWWQNVPSRMAGFLAFISVPAATALALAIHSRFVDAQANDLRYYDPALQVMVYSAVVAIAVLPLAHRIHRRFIHREAA